MRLALEAAQHGEGQAVAWVGIVAQVGDKLRSRRRHGEDPPPPRLRRQPLEELSKSVEILRLCQADLGRAAVAQDQPAGLCRILVRRRNETRADVRLHEVPFQRTSVYF